MPTAQLSAENELRSHAKCTNLPVHVAFVSCIRLIVRDQSHMWQSQDLSPAVVQNIIRQSSNIEQDQQIHDNWNWQQAGHASAKWAIPPK